MVVHEGWRQRLLAAVDNDGRSGREISVAAGLGVNYIAELRNAGKDPRVKKIIKLADELGVSLSYVFLGVEATPEDEALLMEMRQMSEEQRRHLLGLVQALTSRK